MVRPYSYQRLCINAVVAARRQRRPAALFIKAPGLGKTLTAAFSIKELLRRFGKGRVLFLCHQNDILEQAQGEFERVFGNEYRYGFFFGGDHSGAKKSDFLFASFQTMRDWRERFRRGEFRYIVVDESHHSHAATYKPTIDYFRPDFYVAMTATPDRMDLLDIRAIYGQEVFSLPIEEALVRRLLTPVDYRLVTDEIQNSDVLDTPIGKLSVRHLNRVLFIPKRDKEIARIVMRHAKRMKNPRMIFFCQSVKHCNRMAKEIEGAVAVHHKLNRLEQRLRLRMFRHGKRQAVLTVDKLNEGIDVPEANIIVFLRSTASHTVFFQQLGRGLRRLRGKSKVLVLDFVANCDRLVMLEQFHRQVQKAQKEYGQRAKKRTVRVKYGNIRFTEVAKRVLDVVHAIRGGYTREMLIAQLQRLAKEIGRIPTTDDIRQASRLGKIASFSTFHNKFGSITSAQEAAGMTPSKTNMRCTSAELISQLKLLAEELGWTPTDADIRRASRLGKIAGSSTFRERFGSFAAAQRLAGLSVRLTRFNRKELVNQLQRLARELGRTPTSRDIREASKLGKCANDTTFRNRFGSIVAAQHLACLQPNRHGGWRKEVAH